MPTLIDSLVVRLGLESKGFAQDSADATNKMRSLEDQIAATTKSLRELNKTGDKKSDNYKKESDALSKHLDGLKQQQRAMRRANEDTNRANDLQKESAKGYENVTSGAVKFLAVLAGAIALKEFVSDSIQANYALQRMSTNLNVSVSSLSAWGNAAKLFGGGAEDVAGTFQMMRGAEYQLFRGSGAMPQVGRYYTQIGMGMGEFRKTPEEQLMDVQRHSLKTFGRDGKYTGDQREMAFQAGNAAGIAPSLMTMMLTTTSAQLKENLATLKKLAPNEEQTKEQTELLKTMVLLGAEFRKLGWDILGLFSPFVSLLSGWVQKLTKMDPGKRDAVLTAAGISGLGFMAGSVVLMKKARNWFVRSMGAQFAKGVAGNAAAGVAEGAGASAGAVAGEGAVIAGEAEASAVAAPGTLGTSLLVGLVAIVCTAVVYWMATHWDTVKQLAGKAKDAAIEVGHKVSGYASRAWDSVSSSRVMRFFEGKGWTSAQAAGLTARVNRESKGRADQQEIGGGKGYGLLQWGPARQAEFKKWSGHDIHGSTEAEQLEFMQYELTKGKEKRAGDRLRGAKTAAEAGEIASLSYARPRDRAGEASRTAREAQLLMGIAGASNMPMIASHASTLRGGSTSTMSVGEVHVHTQATDAPGIAKDIKNALNYEFTANANGAVS
jgi:hypothetical protein